MKKLIFIMLAFALYVGSALANDVGKLPASITIVTIDTQHAVLSSAVDITVFETAPVLMQDARHFLKLNNSDVDSWRNPDYGRIFNMNRVIRQYSPGIKLYKSTAVNYNVNNSYGLRY